jgi:hypothetical protein
MTMTFQYDYCVAFHQLSQQIAEIISALYLDDFLNEASRIFLVFNII